MQLVVLFVATMIICVSGDPDSGLPATAMSGYLLLMPTSLYLQSRSPQGADKPRDSRESAA